MRAAATAVSTVGTGPGALKDSQPSDIGVSSRPSRGRSSAEDLGSCSKFLGENAS